MQTELGASFNPLVVVKYAWQQWPTAISLRDLIGFYAKEKEMKSLFLLMYLASLGQEAVGNVNSVSTMANEPNVQYIAGELYASLITRKKLSYWTNSSRAIRLEHNL